MSAGKDDVTEWALALQSAGAKRKPGRPPGDPLARRTSTLLLRLTPAEHDALREGADRDGERLAEWLRDLAIERAHANGK